MRVSGLGSIESPQGPPKDKSRDAQKCLYPPGLLRVKATMTPISVSKNKESIKQCVCTLFCSSVQGGVSPRGPQGSRRQGGSQRSAQKEEPGNWKSGLIYVTFWLCLWGRPWDFDLQAPLLQEVAIKLLCFSHGGAAKSPRALMLHC